MTHTLQVIVLLAIAPALQGVLAALRARLSGRPGPPVIQPYRTLRKLLNKEALVPAHTSIVPLLAPGVALGSTVTLAILVPPIAHGRLSISSVLAIAFTLALGRFVLVVAALDTRSAFAGMAASREMLFASLTEAPLILALATSQLGSDLFGSLLASAGFLIIILAETARMPVDNQETHYELTMIHEGMLLEYGGPPLAALTYASYVRQAALFVLAALLLPGGALVACGAVVTIAVIVPVIERSFAKMRLFEVPTLFVAALILTLASIAIRIVGVGA